MVQLSHQYMTTRKITALTIQTCVSKAVSLFFNTLFWFVIAFLPRSKHLLNSWLESPSRVIWEPKKIKSVTVSIFLLLITVKWWDQMPWPQFFECWVLSQLFHSPSSPSSRGFLVIFSVTRISSAYSPSTLDLSLWFIQPSILHDVLCTEVKQAGWQYTALTYSFPNVKQVSCFTSGSNSYSLICIQFSQEAGKMVWYSHLFKNFP